MSFGGSGGSSTIAGASDVVMNAPATDQVLTYDGTSAKWKNKAATGAGAVSSVNTKTGAVVLTAANVGAVSTTSANMRIDYGTTLPAAGTPGRFFIVVPS